jgi:hypothetical protein
VVLFHSKGLVTFDRPGVGVQHVTSAYYRVKTHILIKYMFYDGGEGEREDKERKETKSRGSGKEYDIPMR